MPPHRRRPNTPTRRPKVAGLRNRPESPREPNEEPVSGVLDGVIGAEPAIEPEEPAKSRAKPRQKPEPKAKAEPETEPATERSKAEPATEPKSRSKAEPAAERKPRPKPEPKSRPPKPQPTPSSGARPAGKRRATGTARPANLEAAEAGSRKGRPSRHAKPAAAKPQPTAAQRQLSVALVLAVIAVVLTGLAIFFRGKSTDLTSADSNTALTDPAATSQAISQISNAIKTTFSYNYTDLDSTAKAVKETLTGKALCEYNLLFDEVIRFAPEQKLILATTVREIALVRLDGNRAEALVYFDQSSTRVDTNKSATAGGQFVVMAFRDGKNWKINEFDMFGQPLPGNKPAPKC